MGTGEAKPGPGHDPARCWHTFSPGLLHSMPSALASLAMAPASVGTSGRASAQGSPQHSDTARAHSSGSLPPNGPGTRKYPLQGSAPQALHPARPGSRLHAGVSGVAGAGWQPGCCREPSGAGASPSSSTVPGRAEKAPRCRPQAASQPQSGTQPRSSSSPTSPGQPQSSSRRERIFGRKQLRRASTRDPFRLPGTGAALC